ncbi:MULTISPECIES: hypothetical protein [Mesobacillus]|uniref:Uncharacterized protein n=2 Tax=Mesobacillus TaxID=2675231 RepID=A0A0D6Z6L5_9BACI|nr:MULTISPECIES: hypothetical protein [Mesobacillus]KIY20935.1 hypothetical protein UB32_16425 [Mesobacillus subterraneus]MDQ0414333.1 hypothetical protein [Mesobacillus stamsii]
MVTDHYSGETYTATAGKVTLAIPAKADGGIVLLTVDSGKFTSVRAANRSPFIFGINFGVIAAEGVDDDGWCPGLLKIKD